ncbi:MAG: hypothetical protein JWL90_4061 [Chthoniobacteraceae bacterium]|nr:hypothetical protein [Chthoniobacteraceae bacterium]
MAANEGDPLVRYFMHQGLVPLLLISVVYVAVIITLVSILPTRIGLVLILCFTLRHYFGACTWLHFRFGMAYELVDRQLLVLLVVPVHQVVDGLPGHLIFNRHTLHE